MNMAVKRVRKSPKGLARKRLGTKAHFSINASPPPSSTMKNRTFRTIKPYVTSGTVLRAESSSPIGNIRFYSFYFRVNEETDTQSPEAAGWLTVQRCGGWKTRTTCHPVDQLGGRWPCGLER